MPSIKTDGILEMRTDDCLASSIAQSLRIPHVVARLLVSRGIRTMADAHRMLCSIRGMFWIRS